MKVYDDPSRGAKMRHYLKMNSWKMPHFVGFKKRGDKSIFQDIFARNSALALPPSVLSATYVKL